MSNPFLLPPQSVISFSGGRTSGLMLRRVLDAFDSALPADRRVIFCNTGKERVETLNFVHECSLRWQVPIVWLEYRKDDSKPVGALGRNGQPSIGRHSWTETNYATASRDGRPFDELIGVMAQFRREVKGRDAVLPNPVQRFCTGEMKVRTLGRYLLSIGWNLETTTDAVGLRADEPKRVAKLNAKRRVKTNVLACGLPVAPLAEAGISEPDVMDFWSRQPFDLQLKQHEGNCDLCFLKSAKKQTAILQDRPDLADWWIMHEKTSGQTFRNDRPCMADMLAIAQKEQEEPGWLWADGNNGSCGELDECKCTD